MSRKKLREPKILDHLSSDGSMSTDVLVYVPPHQNVLAIRDRIMPLFMPQGSRESSISQSEESEHLRLHEPLPEASEFLTPQQ